MNIGLPFVFLKKFLFAQDLKGKGNAVVGYELTPVSVRLQHKLKLFHSDNQKGMLEQVKTSSIDGR